MTTRSNELTASELIGHAISLLISTREENSPPPPSQFSRPPCGARLFLNERRTRILAPHCVQDLRVIATGYESEREERPPSCTKIAAPVRTPEMNKSTSRFSLGAWLASSALA